MSVQRSQSVCGLSRPEPVQCVGYLVVPVQVCRSRSEVGVASTGYPKSGGHLKRPASATGLPRHLPSAGYPKTPSAPGSQGYPSEKLQSYPTTRFDAREVIWTSPAKISDKGAPREELVPKIIEKKVMQYGPRSVSIEMNWSETGLIPGHLQKTDGKETWGGKYLQLACELRTLLAPTGIEVFDFRSPCIKRGHRIFDRFSNHERGLQVSSNMSHAATNPSRLGAFEVHVVQNTWQPRCCPGTHARDHRGPPVHRPEGIFCTACAEQWPDWKEASQVG